MKKQILVFIAAITFSGVLLSQQPNRPKDNPQARFEFELLKVKDPKTGEIPPNIRLLESAFAEDKLARRSALRGPGDISMAWANRGPDNQGGRTRALAVDVDDEDIILAGGVSGGMWRSTDGGATWTKTTGSNELQSVTCIAQDVTSTDNDTWYYGTGEWAGNSASGSGATYRGNGLYKSEDNGASWTAVTATQNADVESFNTRWRYVNEIAVDPTDGTVIAAIYDAIMRSTDGGDTWTTEVGGTNDLEWTDIVITSTGMMYAARSGDGVYSSSDGDTWTEIGSAGPGGLVDGERMELAISADDETILYLLAEDASSSSSTDHSLFVWDEDTDTWSDRSDQIPVTGGLTGDFTSQGGYDLLITVDPTDVDHVIIGGINLFRSTDGFATTGNTDWIGGYTTADNSYALYSDHHPDQHSFAWLSSSAAISGNDGGVQVTSDITSDLGSEPVDWTPINSGYLTSQVYAISIGPDDQIAAGFQDNGTYMTHSTDGSVDWYQPTGGDGAYNAWSSDGVERYTSFQNGAINQLFYADADDQTLNGFEQDYSPATYSAGLFIAPLYLDPSNDELLYFGGDANGVLWVNTQASTADENTGWKSVTLTGTSGVVSEFGVSQTEGTVYVGTSGGKLYKITNAQGSESVTDVTGGSFPSGYVSGIAVNQEDADEVLVSFSNYEVISLWHSTDGGSNWTDVSGDLEENSDGSGSGPSVRTVGILGDGLRYFAGTSTGLYSTTTLNGTSTVWAQESSSDIGAVVVEHMVVRSSDGLVVVGTHGNGVFSATYDVNALPTLTTFSDAVATTDQDTEVEITFSAMTTQGDEADSDGTVDAFVVKSVTSGTLKIGTSAGAATDYVASTNDVINASNNAYWTPASAVTGADIAAFEVVARDDDSAESSSNVTASVDVNSVDGWDGSTDGDWGTASNWSTGSVPTSGDDITINNVANDPIVSGDYAVNNIALNVGSNVTINSGSSLAIMGSVSGTGTFTVNRDVSGNSTELYTMISSPVAGANTSDLGGFYTYTFDGTDYVAYSGTMTAGEGYLVFFDNNQSKDLSLTGIPNAGNVDVTIPAGQFKVVGNPYSAALDFTAGLEPALGAATTGNIWIWDDGGADSGSDRAGDYVTINSGGVTAASSGVTGNTWNGNVGSMQAFFVEGNGSGGTLSFTPSMQSTDAGDNADDGHFRVSDNIQRVKLGLSGNGFYNEIIVVLSESATFDEDYSLDAKKLEGTLPIAFYSKQEDQSYAIQGLPFPSEENDLDVKLGHTLYDQGTYTISLLDESIDNSYEVYLIDKVDGVMYDLRLTNEITFSSDVVENADRFELSFRVARVLVVNEIRAENLKVYGNKDGLKVLFNQNGEYPASIIAMDGRELFSGNLQFNNQIAELPIDLKRGRIYVMRVADQSVKFTIQK